MTLFRFARAAPCGLVALACCTEHLPLASPGGLDAALDATRSADAHDLGDGSDAAQVTSDAVTDDTAPLIPADSGDELVDDSPDVPDARRDMATAPDATDASEPSDAATDPVGVCGAVIEAHAIEGANHVAVCSHVTYATKPPSSGDHYPIWAAYRSYSSPIPDGFWVHNLEHGAVVLSYDCPSGCPGDVAAAQSWIDSLPDDPQCLPDAGGPRVRVIMTPDPNLDVAFAASAWGWTLRANCFDPAAFAAFAQAHYGQGPEVNCAEGQDLSLGFQDGCGE
jgi:Protein of unknown function (DUF3105)